MPSLPLFSILLLRQSSPRPKKKHGILHNIYPWIRISEMWIPIRSLARVRIRMQNCSHHFHRTMMLGSESGTELLTSLPQDHDVGIRIDFRVQIRCRHSYGLAALTFNVFYVFKRKGAKICNIHSWGSGNFYPLNLGLHRILILPDIRPPDIRQIFLPDIRYGQISG